MGTVPSGDSASTTRYGIGERHALGEPDFTVRYESPASISDEDLTVKGTR